MTHKWEIKMILSSILLVLIFIRHTVIGTYENEYKPRWSGIHQNQQHALTAQQALPFPHHQHRHHHADNMQKTNREMHMKSKQNDTNDGTMVQVRDRNGHNNRSFIWPNRVYVNNNDAPTSTLKAEYTPRSTWSHNNRHHQENYHHKERISQKQNNQRTFLEKTSRIDYVDPRKISHEEQRLKNKDEYDEDYDSKQFRQENQHYNERNSQAHNNQRSILGKTSSLDSVDPGKITHENEEKEIKSKDEYDEDYDENDYYQDEKVNENENTIEVLREDTDTETDYLLDESDIQKEEVKSEEEADTFFGGLHGRQDVENYYNTEGYLSDESYPMNDEQNRTMSLTEMKWKELGTPGAVLQQFMGNKVSEHMGRINKELNCRWPHPKVIPVIEASNSFIPHCTVLHRCADDTGCCNDTKTCVAKKTTSVDLYFYITFPFGDKKKTSIGYRTFENHTECHCVERSRFRRASRQNNFAVIANTTVSNVSCRCPSHFRVVKERSQCRCDCLSWNQKCYDLREGKDRFSNKDQKCISENKCQKPSCEYGHYNKHTGRCPKLSKPSPRRKLRYLSDLETKILNRPS